MDYRPCPPGGAHGRAELVPCQRRAGGVPHGTPAAPESAGTDPGGMEQLGCLPDRSASRAFLGMGVGIVAVRTVGRGQSLDAIRPARPPQRFAGKFSYRSLSVMVVTDC